MQGEKMVWNDWTHTWDRLITVSEIIFSLGLSGLTSLLGQTWQPTFTKKMSADTENLKVHDIGMCQLCYLVYFRHFWCVHFNILAILLTIIQIGWLYFWPTSTVLWCLSLHANRIIPLYNRKKLILPVRTWCLDK